ncbi:dipeptide/oligopeptide/nickel ABC transporter permease/ATP-binding protein [Nesterenkonia ebinurensis]|uniref:dipeptide/oligopeptide/nickel ABC transporter permease/ATP-binding protein n=1 Tax=Nesterenkonia ebinurensis TaxID=2608252 RepID=UPI00123D464C|nr:dipeptide/oligopeptide/nickel ABC transporter permease/ATP-binding protein [Nesterenkonia ebinurensis]
MSIETPQAAEKTSVRPGAWKRLISNPLGVTSVIVLLLVILMSILAPWIAPHDPRYALLDQINASPNATYWLGGDVSGRDILSRLIWGGRTTLVAALIVIVVAVVIGISTGLVAAYAGKISDTVLSWIADALLAIPSIIVLIAVYAAFGPRIALSMFIFGILISPFLFRLVRALAISVKNEAYVEAARVSGVPPVRIIFRHILVVIRGPIIVMMADITATAMTIQASLEFLGLGSINTVTWGGMIEQGFIAIYQAPLSVVWPGLLLTVTIGSVALLGNAVRDALVPGRASARRRRHSVKTPTRTGGAWKKHQDTGPSAFLTVKDLTVSYPHGEELRNVVEGVSFSVDRGEVLGLVGESGSGKSQSVFAVLGLLPEAAQVTGGQITLDGAPLPLDGQGRHRPRRMAYVPQEPMSNLDPVYTVGYQLTAPMRRVLKLSMRQARAHAMELLSRVGIHESEKVYELYPHQVSGGMAQRVLIAGAISMDPELLVADEPTTALDVTVQADILDLLRDLQMERNMAMLMVTHNFGVVADICDNVAVMRSGAVVEAGGVDKIFNAPEHPYTQALLKASLEGAPTRDFTTGGGHD